MLSVLHSLHTSLLLCVQKLEGQLLLHHIAQQGSVHSVGWDNTDKLPVLCCQVKAEVWQGSYRGACCHGYFRALVSEPGRADCWLHLERCCSFLLSASHQAARKMRNFLNPPVLLRTSSAALRIDPPVHLFCNVYYEHGYWRLKCSNSFD